jgi:hypothetical protein
MCLVALIAALCPVQYPGNLCVHRLRGGRQPNGGGNRKRASGCRGIARLRQEATKTVE